MRWAAPVIRAGGQADATEDSGDSGKSSEGKLGWRAPGPVIQGLIAFVIYLVIFILALAQSLLPHLNVPKVGQVQVDPQIFIWDMRWWPYAITHGLNPFFTNQVGAPAGVNLAWVTTVPTISVLMWPVTALVGPIASFNLTLLLAPPTSAWAAFLVARRMTGRFWAALPAGCVYAFNIGEMFNELSGWLNLSVTLLLPLMVYLVLLWWDGTLKRNAFIIWMTVALAGQFYTFDEVFADMTLVGAAAFVIGFVVATRDNRRKVVRLALHTAIAYLGALVLAAPYLYYALRHYPTTLTRQVPWDSLDLSSLVLPRPDRLLGMRWWAAAAGHDLKASSYVGIPLLVLLFLLVVTRWSSRVNRLLALVFVAVVTLAVGPNLYVDGRYRGQLPWGWLWHMPLLKSAMPLRLMVFGYLVLAIALSLWLAQLTKSKVLLSARWGLGMLAVAAIFADLPTFASVVVPPKPIHKWVRAHPSLPLSDQMPTFFTHGIYKKYIKPGETVVVISHRGNAGMLFQSYTDFYFKIQGGFINASFSRIDALPVPVALLSHPLNGRVTAFREYAKKTDLGAVIVERAWSENWMYIFGQMGYKTTTVGGVTIFQLPGHQ